MKKTVLFLILVVLSALLLSLPWLVPHLGFLALVGFVPLLCAERVASQEGSKRFFLWYYLCFVLWNAFTTFWVCNATVAGGIAAILVNAMLMSVVFALFRVSKRSLGGVLPYFFLMAAWVAWERFYFSTQISWPWLTLGNAFARSTELAQWYDITGSLGGSVWIWAVNLTVFAAMVVLSDGRWNGWNIKARIAFGIWAVLIIAGPATASFVRGAQYQERSEGTVDVLIGQPDFDPYQKFESLTQQEQDNILLEQYADAAKDSVPELFLAPETFVSAVVTNTLEDNLSFVRFGHFLEKYPSSSFLFGASTYDFITTDKRPSPFAVPYGGMWMMSHNSAIIMDSTLKYEIFHKSKLVIGTESMPYPILLDPIDKKLGYVCGRCVGQDKVSVLHLQDGTALGCAVCYESCYGEYCTEYVKKGAKFLTVITNDAWWGDTPGYKQHLSYSALRAIELRRDIARCGNTGISAFINQKGEILNATQWWTRQTLRGKVNLNSEQTFFVKHGDSQGRVCTICFLMLLLLMIAKKVSGGFRRER